MQDHKPTSYWLVRMRSPEDPSAKLAFKIMTQFGEIVESSDRYKHWCGCRFGEVREWVVKKIKCGTIEFIRFDFTSSDPYSPAHDDLPWSHS